jgi:hypothetical protein
MRNESVNERKFTGIFQVEIGYTHDVVSEPQRKQHFKNQSFKMIVKCIVLLWS